MLRLWMLVMESILLTVAAGLCPMPHGKIAEPAIASGFPASVRSSFPSLCYCNVMSRTMLFLLICNGKWHSPAFWKLDTLS